MMFGRLRTREKYALGLAGVCIAIFLLLQLVVFPLTARRERLRRLVAVKQQNLHEIQAMKIEIQALRQNKDRFHKQFAKRQTGWTLFSFLDRLAGKAGIKDHVDYMRPVVSAHKDAALKVSTVEMKLQNLSLKQLVRYLYMTETAPDMVTINRLAITKSGGANQSLTAVLQVRTLTI